MKIGIAQSRLPNDACCRNDFHILVAGHEMWKSEAADESHSLWFFSVIPVDKGFC
jgi:hypothetical protein